MATFMPAAHDQLQATMPSKMHRRHPWLIALGIVILAMVGLTILGAAQTPTTVSCTSRACTQPPPNHQMLAAPNRYTSTDFGFSVDYSTSNITPSTQNANTIAWDAMLRDNSEVSWSFQGINPQGRDDQQIVNEIQQNNFPDATFAYRIPGADLGYTPGYGAIYDLTTTPGGGAAVHERLIIIAAIKRGVAVAFVGMGPYRRSNPQTAGHPDPADTPLVDLADFEQNITSVVWKGDPPL